MITVTFFYSGQDIIGFESEGHAGYDEEGYDIVCSAVSALTINTANSIQHFTDVDFTTEEEPGGGYLKLLVESEISPEAELLLKSLRLGLESIAKNYGEEFLYITQMDRTDPGFADKFPPVIDLEEFEEDSSEDEEE